MKKIVVFPTWLIVILIKPFLPKQHLFKHKISLSDWAKHSTKLNYEFSVFFWAAIILILIILPLAASGQILNTKLSESLYRADTVKGAALVVLSFNVENGDGTERTRFQGAFLPVYRVRQQTDVVQVNEPTGQLKAYITHYYQRDWSELSKEDVALFLKKDWK